MTSGDQYDRSVFINCPFDDEYRPLFRAAVFVVYYCGYLPRCAVEVDDSGATRFGRIIELIRGSCFGLHDLSRVESTDGLPRFNMPFELGLFLGCKCAGGPRQRRKVALVLDSVPHRFKQSLSDIAGQDSRSHGGEPKELIQQVRNWLFNQTAQDLPGGLHVWHHYTRFQAEVPALLAATRKSVADLDNFLDYSRLVYDWVTANTAPI